MNLRNVFWIFFITLLVPRATPKKIPKSVKLHFFANLFFYLFIFFFEKWFHDFEITFDNNPSRYSWSCSHEALSSSSSWPASWASCNLHWISRNLEISLCNKSNLVFCAAKSNSKSNGVSKTCSLVLANLRCRLSCNFVKSWFLWPRPPMRPASLASALLTWLQK